MTAQEILIKHSKDEKLHAALKWWLSAPTCATQKERDAQRIAIAYIELSDALRINN